jgi:hypothetical protein
MHGYVEYVTLAPIISFGPMIGYSWNVGQFENSVIGGLHTILPFDFLQWIMITCRQCEIYYLPFVLIMMDRLCGLVVRVLGYRSGGPGSIIGTTRKKESSWSGTGSTQPREYNWGATWLKSSGSCLENREYGRRYHHSDNVAPSIRKSWQPLRRQAAVARSV